MGLGIPRCPLANLRTEDIVILVALLQLLGTHLSLLFVPRHAAHLEAPNARPEVVLGMELLLQLGLLLEQEVLPGGTDLRLIDVLLLLPNIGLIVLHDGLDTDTAATAEIGQIGVAARIECIRLFVQSPVNGGGLVGQKGLHALHLPFHLVVLQKALKEEVILLVEHILGAQETDKGVLLSVDGLVLVKIIFDRFLGHVSSSGRIQRML